MQFGREAEKYVTSSVHADAAALAALVDLLKPAGGWLLDVGTGTGHTGLAFAPHVTRVVASDLTPQMLRVTGRTAQEQGVANLALVLAAAERAPFRNGAFDYVTSRTAAHHFDDVAAFLRESVRVLAPGGVFLLVDTIGADDEEADGLLDELERRRDPSHRRNLTLAKWRSLSENAGLRVESATVVPKRIALTEWLERMSVAPEERRSVTAMIAESTGAFRDYLAPGHDFFHLAELTLLARKPK
ncbi:MAG: class I SAM-dependent methyltransferase [Fimbriimonadaceae bacterium]|nr:class I SAM-dependent methyltransferase [Fimbriimonadaceae bacterium]QYK55180.1 MAG: class I SAM-dependent methyltransferase [Fimbriimonadaceae bacterium]